MRIGLVLAQRLGSTGSGIFTNNLAHGLASIGHEVSVLCTNGDCEPANCYISVFRAGSYVSTSEMSFLQPGMSDVMPYSTSIFSQLSREQTDAYVEFWKGRIRDFLKLDLDVLHVNHCWLVAKIVSEIYKRPFIITVHGTDLEQWKKCKILVSRYQLSSLSHAILHFVSPRLRIVAENVGLCCECGVVVPPPCRDDIFTYSPDKIAREGTAYVGKLSEQKGLMELFRAFSLLQKRFKGEKLRIVGTSSLGDKKWRRVATAFGCGDEILWHGFLEQRSLVGIYRKSRALIIPSWSEGFGMVGVEAASCGAAIIMPEFGGADFFLRQYLPQRKLFLFEPLRSSSKASKSEFIAKMAQAWCSALSTTDTNYARRRGGWFSRRAIAEEIVSKLYCGTRSSD